MCGWPVPLWDIDLGEQYDLCVRANQQRIIHRIQSGMVRAGHLGSPCGSSQEQEIDLGDHPNYAATAVRWVFKDFGQPIARKLP